MSNENNRHYTIKGVKIRRINILLIIAILVGYVFLFYFSVRSNSHYRILTGSTGDYVASLEHQKKILETTEYLSGQVRSYVDTGDIACIENYFSSSDARNRRTEALSSIAAYELTDEMRVQLNEVSEWIAELNAIDCRAFHMAAKAFETDISLLPVEVQDVIMLPGEEEMDTEECAGYARSLITGDSYVSKISSVYSTIAALNKSKAERLYDVMASDSLKLDDALLYERSAIAAIFALTLILFAILTIFISNPLKVYMNRIENDSMIEMIGSYELKYIALTYNHYYTMNKKMNDIVTYSEEHDELTGLVNIKTFSSIAESLKIHGVNLCMVLIQLEDYEEMVRTYGKGKMDDFMIHTSNFLVKAVRIKDCVARLSDDRFGIIMLDFSKEYVDVVTRKMNELIDDLRSEHNTLPQSRLSIGAALSEDGYKPELFLNAEAAMKESQSAGGNQCVISKKILKIN